MGVAAYLAIHLIHLAGLYVPLTYFGGLWSGAESEGRHGWIAALLAAFAVVLLFLGIDVIAVLMQRPPPDLLHYDIAHEFLGIDNRLPIYLFDLVYIFFRIFAVWTLLACPTSTGKEGVGACFAGLGGAARHPRSCRKSARSLFIE